MVKNFNIADVYDSQILEILAKKNVEKQKQENLKIFKKLPIDTNWHVIKKLAENQKSEKNWQEIRNYVNIAESVTKTLSQSLNWQKS